MENIVTYKTCFDCKELKPSTEYYKGKGSCKICLKKKKIIMVKVISDKKKLSNNELYNEVLKLYE